MWVRNAARACTALLLGACAPAPPPSDVPPAPTPGIATVAPEEAEAPIGFSCADLTGATVSTASVEGRVTVLLFLTSYDPASTAEAEFLRDLSHTHAPRINVVGFALEREGNRPLIEGFAQAAKLEYPICIADADTIAGRGTFAGMNSVPSVLILDKSGHPQYRFIGFQKAAELEAAIQGVE
ncbi:MAG: TlpA family protein disulfide reductase [Polyangiaceae bacterium]